MMPTALEIQQQQWAAQQEAMQAGQVHTTGGITPNIPSYTAGNAPLGNGVYVDPRTGKIVNTTGGGYFGAGTPVPAQTGTAAGSPGTSDPNSAYLTSLRSSAFADFKNILQQWGLGDLAGWAQALYQSENAPTSFNEFYLKLKEQPTYKQRFGDTNDMRIKAGLPALSEASIMGLESQYKKTLATYGLPASFYDQPSDFQKFIANDLSASEVADRVQAADALVKMQNPVIKQQLAAYYGIGDGALIAAQLDPQKGQQILEQLAAKQTAAIAAGTAGLGIAEANQATAAGANNMSFNKQAQAFSEAAQMGATGNQLSTIYANQGADQYGVSQAIDETFSGANASQSQEKRRRLSKMELNTFSGSSAIDKSSLYTGETSGAL